MIDWLIDWLLQICWMTPVLRYSTWKIMGHDFSDIIYVWASWNVMNCVGVSMESVTELNLISLFFIGVLSSPAVLLYSSQPRPCILGYVCLTIEIYWREGFLGGIRKCCWCVDSISEQCFSDWVLKVSVLETGHTRYCSISGSDPLRQSYRLCHGYCRKTPTTNNQLWTVHLNGSMQLNILDKWKF